MSRRLFLPLFVAGSILGLFLNIAHEWVLFLIVLDSLLVLAAVLTRLFFFSANSGRKFLLPDVAVAAVIFLTGIINSQRSTSEESLSIMNSAFVEEISASMNGCVDTLFPETSSERGRGLLKALVLGNRSELDSRIKRNFRKSGASHVLALSGMHIGIIYCAILLLLVPLNLAYGFKRAKLPLALTFMVLYVIVTGLSPSACRAVLMIGMNLWARENGRSGYIETPLLLSAAILLLIDPGSARSVSFQLSFAAMAGIVFIFPALSNAFDNLFHDTGAVGKQFTNQESLKLFTRVKLRRINPLKALLLWILRTAYQLCAISISCQITTSPLVFHYFGSMPQHFLITNILVSPIVSITIYLFVMTGFMYMLSLGATSLFCHCGDFFASLLHLMSTVMGKLLDILISVIEWLAA